MGLREDLLRGIYAYGFEKPSAIQQRAIKPVTVILSPVSETVYRLVENKVKILFPGKIVIQNPI